MPFIQYLLNSPCVYVSSCNVKAPSYYYMASFIYTDWSFCSRYVWFCSTVYVSCLLLSSLSTMKRRCTELFRLLGYYAEWSGLNRHFGTTYRSHLQAFGTACSLNVGLISGSETSVSNHLTPRNSPKDRRIQFNFGGSLRYRWHCTFQIDFPASKLRFIYRSS